MISFILCTNHGQSEYFYRSKRVCRVSNELPAVRKTQPIAIGKNNSLMSFLQLLQWFQGKQRHHQVYYPERCENDIIFLT